MGPHREQLEFPEIWPAPVCYSSCWRHPEDLQVCRRVVVSQYTQYISVERQAKGSRSGPGLLLSAIEFPNSNSANLVLIRP